MGLDGIAQVRVQTNHLVGVQDAPQGLNGQAVHQGANQVLRGLQDAFAGVKTFFKSLGDRIQAHHESNVEKARTKACDKSARSLVDTLLNPPVNERKAISNLLTLCDKAGKLDSTAPYAKAMGFLDGKLQGLTDEQKSSLLNGNFGMLKHLMTESGRIARDKGNAIALALHDTGFVSGEKPTPQTEPSAKEKLAGRILDSLQNEGNALFAPERNKITNDLTTYFTTQQLNAQLMFRGNAEVTKTMASHLTAVNGSALESLKQQTIDVTKNTAKKTGEMEIGSYGKLDLAKISPKQFDALLNGAEKLMESLMGGATEDGARIAANDLAPNVVRLLQTQDQKVNQHLNGDATARETAFVGTLFLRSLTFSLTNAQAGQSEHDAAIMKLFSQVVTFTLNQASDVGIKMPDLSPKNQEALQAFINDHAAPMAAFRNTALARTDV